jgi:hypothetical protein
MTFPEVGEEKSEIKVNQSKGVVIINAFMTGINAPSGKL